METAVLQCFANWQFAERLNLEEMAPGGEGMTCFAYLSAQTPLGPYLSIGWTPPHALVMGLMGALGSIEAVRAAWVVSRIRAPWLPEKEEAEIQVSSPKTCGTSAQSAPTLRRAVSADAVLDGAHAALERSREAERAAAWLD